MRPVGCLLFMFAILSPTPSLGAQGTAQAPPQAGPAQAKGAALTLVRSVSGTETSQQSGQLIVHDPRTTFYVPDDKQLTVYFEWDGKPGKHHFEGLWKDPSGRVVVVSAFDYEATTQRFGAYWQLTLNEQMQTGWWALEARVDGESGGSHSFEIVARPRPDLPPAHRVLTLDEIYQRALAASVFIEKIDAQNNRLGVGAGFRLAPDGLVVTAFHNIDGATTLRVKLGSRVTTVDSVLVWDRKLDYALLRLPGGDNTGALPAVEASSWKVGDRVFMLDVPSEGNWAIVDGNIIGKSVFPEVGERLTLSLPVRDEASGGVLINEYGEVLGLVQGRLGLLPGAWSLKRAFGALLGNTAGIVSSMGLPLEALPSPLPKTPTPLGELARRGLLTRPLVGSEMVLNGTLARDIQERHGMQQTVDERYEFRRTDPYMHALVIWNPTRKGKYRMSLRLFDINNRSHLTTRPEKISFSPNELKYSSWKITFTSMPPGTYRVDVLLDEAPAWRTFFRIVE